MIVFEGIAPVLAGALTKHGYTELTPVQTAMLEPEAAGADLLVSAQTGSGKTVAFGLAMAPELLAGSERVQRASDPLVVAVAPTRELALQVRRELEWLYEPAGARIVSCVGGMDMRQERRTLADGAHIVVGTPGRLCDHIRRGSLDMSSVRTLVLDEADEMLDLGFREDLEFILGAAPAERRTLMFSATMPKPIVSLAKRFQRDAIRISMIQENKQHADIEYRTVTVGGAERENAVINVLRYFEAASALVFCATREGVNRLSSRLGDRGFAVVALSGELSQNERTRALQSMRDGRARVCVATDVASRGIDLPNLDLVIHADLPKNGEALLHRSGRTGRAGRSGLSVLITPYSKRSSMERVLRTAGIDAGADVAADRGRHLQARPRAAAQRSGLRRRSQTRKSLPSPRNCWGCEVRSRSRWRSFARTMSSFPRRKNSWIPDRPRKDRSRRATTSRAAYGSSYRSDASRRPNRDGFCR